MTSTSATHRPGPVGWPIRTTPLVLPVEGRPGPVGWFGSRDSGESHSDDGDSSEDETVTELDVSRTRIRSVLDDAVGVARARDGFDTPIAREAAQAVQVRNTSGSSCPSPVHRRVFTVANQKGGVGKTTTHRQHRGRAGPARSARPGHRPRPAGQREHRRSGSSTRPARRRSTTCWSTATPLAEVGRRSRGAGRLGCVPATIDLAGAEIELVSLVARESPAAAGRSRAIGGDYDYILIDCPPSLGLLTVNALVAADEVLIPIQCEYYALEGLGQLLSTIDLIKAHLNPDLHVSTILLTMYDGRTKLADQVADEVRKHFGDLVLDVGHSPIGPGVRGAGIRADGDDLRPGFAGR